MSTIITSPKKIHGILLQLSVVIHYLFINQPLYMDEFMCYKCVINHLLETLKLVFLHIKQLTQKMPGCAHRFSSVNH